MDRRRPGRPRPSERWRCSRRCRRRARRRRGSNRRSAPQASRAPGSAPSAAPRRCRSTRRQQPQLEEYVAESCGSSLDYEPWTVQQVASIPRRPPPDRAGVTTALAILDALATRGAHAYLARDLISLEIIHIELLRSANLPSSERPSPRPALGENLA